MQCLKKVIISSFALLWFMTSFSSPPYSFAETPLDHIKSELRSRELDKRMAAVEKLGQRKDEETVDLLIAVAGNRREAWEVQVKAIQLLGEAKNPKAVELLLYI